VLIEAAEDRRSASARYDSARVQYERIIRLHPQSAGISRYHILLGLAYAGLNRKEDAIREGERAARMSLAYKDALDTYETGTLLAEIYIRCGEDEKAIDQLETVLSTPGYITATLLRIDPIWEPIRANPRFRRLLEEN
jgi:tetratricopeptide (TPR) repeat protein